MKMMIASILICTSLICMSLITSHAFAPAAFESCSCSADDGSCTASAGCPGGCIAFCPNGGGCRAMCIKDEDDTMLTMAPVSLHFSRTSGRAVSAELSRVSGTDVVYTPTVQDATVNLDVDNLPLWDALEILSRSGRIQIGQDDFSNLRIVRRALLNGESMSVCMRSLSVKRLVKELRYLTGLNVHVTSGDDKAVVSFTGKQVNFNDIVAQVSEQTGVQVAVK